MDKLLPTASLTLLLVACGGGGDTAQTEPDAHPMAQSRPVPSAPGAARIWFAGYEFEVRSGDGGPGPNAWSADNAWVDHRGRLHLKIAHREGRWSAAEVATTQPLGFGRYEFRIAGDVGALDRNVVFGLFNYPTPEVGPDATNEIDIEFATWGGVQPQPGNWTVWPAVAGPAPTTQPFTPVGARGASTHRFEWSAQQVSFQSYRGFATNRRSLVASWTFAPASPGSQVPQQPMPLHMNLWLFQGQPPGDGREVEIVVDDFRFEPARRR